jgi:hypothetical protein
LRASALAASFWEFALKSGIDNAQATLYLAAMDRTKYSLAELVVRAHICFSTSIAE